MEDSFRVRVDKAFGSLSSSSSTATPLSYLWCLSDDEIQKIEWNRHKESPDHELESKPYPPNLDGFFANQQQLGTHQNDFCKELESDLQELNEDDDYGHCEFEDNEEGVFRLRNPDDEEGDIRSSIGLDCTLDFEEEEHEHDKVAMGREKDGDELHTRNVYDYGVQINSYKEVPNTLRDVIRDPRANHAAAKIRLIEDAETAGEVDFSQVSDNSAPPAVNMDDGFEVKPILKKRENHADSKSQKRVRFDPVCKNGCEEESKGAKNLTMDTSSTLEGNLSDEATLLSQKSSYVPDHERNPSKYTHYTFDSTSDIDEESNRKAYMDFLNMLKKPSTQETQPDDGPIDLPKSVAFIPKKKPSGATSMKHGNGFKQNGDEVSKGKVSLSIGVAAGDDAHENDIRAMDVDEPETAADENSTVRGSSRQYRRKTSVDSGERS